MNEVIKKIKEELAKPLPGKEIQYSMAPDVRGIFNFELAYQKAGVLFLLYQQNEKIVTVFIKRTEYKGAHSGQISLPGGKFEPGDKDILFTALRETQEEIGIDKTNIDVIGKLTPLDIPVSGFKVFPFVGFTGQVPEFEPDPTEVEYIIYVSISDLIDPLIIKKKMMNINGLDMLVPYFDLSGNHIWGATAMMLAEFVEILKRAIKKR